MKLIRPEAITDSNLESTTATITVDSTNYGSAWAGEWSSSYAGGYDEGDVVYDEESLYESLISANTDDPATSSVGESATWLLLGKTNLYRMFDEFVNTSTEGSAVDPVSNESTIEIVIDQAQIEYVALFNLEAIYITVQLLDSSDTVLWEETVDLYSDVEDVADWYEYFFGDTTQPHTDALIQLGWITYDERIKLTVTNIGLVAECGMCVIGRGRTLGQTQYNPEVGILDYSKKSTDDFGRTYLAQGSWAKVIRASIIVDINSMDSVNLFLAQSRGSACVWEFNEDLTNFNTLLVYGYYQDFRQVLAGRNQVTCSLDIQGLI